MKRVVFHGPLRKFSKTDYLVNASSWREINESMQANLPNYLNLRKKLMADIGHIYFLIDGEPLRDIDNLDNAIKRAEKIDLIPVVAQQGFGAVFAFIGKLILTFAISFAISYFLTKLLTPKDPKQVKINTPSKIPAVCIPLRYSIWFSTLVIFLLIFSHFQYGVKF